MSNKSSDFIGMPEPDLYTQEGNQLSNTNRGNPNGDVVDNSAGSNLPENKKNPTRGSSGHSLGMYSKPSWLCN